jgi:hypothetical protein
MTWRITKSELYFKRASSIPRDSAELVRGANGLQCSKDFVQALQAILGQSPD